MPASATSWSLRSSARARLDDARVVRDLAAAALDPGRPLLANLVVTRRCNLSCGYCFEYDKVSPPVPLAVLRERIDHLRRLRVVFVVLTGGETLLHPDLVAVVAHVRARGMTPLVNTNGTLLSRAIVVELGRAGLYGMQLSIDGVSPTATTRKVLKALAPKLALLADHASFRVRVNTVLGAAPPEEAIAVARAVTAHGFEAKVSLARDAAGRPLALDADGRRAYDEISRLGRRGPRLLREDFQRAILDDGAVSWKCRAGARFFHVCEAGLVHLCAPRHGSPGVPLADYGPADIARAFGQAKACAPACPVAYAHQASRLDRLRRQDGVEAAAPAPRRLPVVA